MTHQAIMLLMEHIQLWMWVHTDIILASKTLSVDETDVKNSHHLENEGLKRCLNELKDHQVSIHTLATDRHPMVNKTMREQYRQINHEFDIWHRAKSLRKKLSAASKKHKDMQQWEKCVVNHFWWCCETCEGDVTQLLERWQSVLRHIVDVHEWRCATKFFKCAHGEQEPKALLEAGGDAHKALQSIVMEKKFQKDMKLATAFCHTGNLEGFHSMLLKYMPQEVHLQPRRNHCKRTSCSLGQ
ncbi:uncharacterized protein LOC117116642 [Anneissia japonica]|uniref:uncharacterized protein LOC117116642 n=1 Tax=Anneissia japonica TaxID=1529436 RepID=UPI001425A3B0|nr:uncharacterized protein LOC117116642 [Anneissia japonica]